MSARHPYHIPAAVQEYRPQPTQAEWHYPTYTAASLYQPYHYTAPPYTGVNWQPHHSVAHTEGWYENFMPSFTGATLETLKDQLNKLTADLGKREAYLNGAMLLAGHELGKDPRNPESSNVDSAIWAGKQLLAISVTMAALMDELKHRYNMIQPASQSRTPE